MKKTIISLFLLSSMKVYSHGNHGGSGKITIEDELAQGSHVHLPVRIEPSGEVIFGYEWPWDHGHDHGGVKEETEHIEEEHEHDHDEASESESEHKFHIAPSLIIGGDYIDRIMSLDVNSQLGEKFEGLKKADPKKGFMQIRRTQLLLGLGVEVHQHLSVEPFGAGLGLSYMKNQTAYSETILKNLNERNRLLKVPASYEDFATWRVGERLSFTTQGSIVFTIGAGIDPLIHGGLVASAAGGWLVRLKKLDDESLEVSLASVNTKSFGVEIDGTVATLATERFKSFEKGMTFKFNARSKSAMEALKKFLQGDLREADQLAQLEIGIKKISSQNGTSLGTAKSINVNIPFLIGFGVAKSKVETFSDSLNHESSEDSKVRTSIVSKEESSRGILSNHKKEMVMFATTYTDEAHEDHRDQYFASSFKWHYEKDDVKASVIENKLMELYVKTGIEEINGLKLNTLGQNSLGYFRVSFDVNFSESDLFNVLNTLKKSPMILKKEIEKNIHQKINTSNVSIFCPELLNSDVAINKTEECKIRQLSQSFRALDGLSKKAGNILASEINQNSNAKISMLGFALLQKPFIFSVIRNELIDSEFVLSLEGEKIQGQVIKFNQL